MRALVLAAGLLVAVAIVSADDHTVLFDDQANFALFKTFTLSTTKVTTSRPELNSQILIQKIGAAARTALTAKGLKELPEKGDLTVKVSVGAVDFGIGPFGRANPIRSGGRGPAPGQADFTDVTLVADLEGGDPVTLVWRGVYHDTENDPGKFAERLPKDIATLFSEFPPKKK